VQTCEQELCVRVAVGHLLPVEPNIIPNNALGQPEQCGLAASAAFPDRALGNNERS